MKRPRSTSFEFNQYSFHCSAAKKCKKTPTQLSIDFINHVEDSLHRSSASNTRKNIENFKLVVKFNRYVREEGDANMQRWLNYAVNNNVRNFFLSYHTNPNYKKGWRYLLPDSLYAASSLETLDLFGCHFSKPRIDHHHATLIGSSLKKLTLSRVFIDQETLQGLIEGCGLLQELTIDLCEGFEAVRVGGQRLEVVDLYLRRDRVQIVEIRAAPSLRCLSYGGGFESVRGSFAASEMGGVEKVSLHDVSLEIGFLQQLIPKVPKLEMERCFIV